MAQEMIELKKYSKSYGSLEAVKPLDLSIQEGETFALLGPNGGGKTTILRAIAGLHQPTSGAITIAGYDVQKTPIEAKKLLAFLPQRVTIPGMLTAREVLELFCDIKQIESFRITEVLELMSLTKDADRHVREFSGGMLQRLGLAVAFLEDVKVLLLDEPTLNLDPLGIELLRDLVRNASGNGTTVVISSHIMQDAAQLADRVGILINGELVRIQRVEEFRNRLSEQTVVRVVLDHSENGVASAAIKAGADLQECSEGVVSFKADPDNRMSIIKSIEGAGAVVEEFHTEPPNWEAFISNYINSERMEN